MLNNHYDKRNISTKGQTNISRVISLI